MIKQKKFQIHLKCLGFFILKFRYDFMVDEEYNTWILEINKSPSMDSKTVFNLNLDCCKKYDC